MTMITWSLAMVMSDNRIDDYSKCPSEYIGAANYL